MRGRKLGEGGSILSRGKFLSRLRLPNSDTKAVPVWAIKCNATTVMLNPLAAHLERYMDLLSARQKLVASNIANADTPGYHTRDIDFQKEFRQAAGLAPQVV